MIILFGIRDFKELFGKDFNLEEYKKIQFAYFVGELEAKDPADERDKEGKKFPKDIAGVSEISMKLQRAREQEANSQIMHE